MTTTGLETISRREAGGAWDELAAQSPSAWLHHHTGWIDAYSTWPGVRDVSFAVLDTDKRLAAVVPCFALARRMGPVTACRLSLHGGPAFKDGLPDRLRRRAVEAILTHLEALGRTNRATGVSAQLPPLSRMLLEADRPLANPLWELGFNDQSAATWITRLQNRDKDQLWEQLEGRARTAVRKAQKANLEVIDGSDPTWLDAYFELHRATSHRGSLAGMPQQFFERIWSDMMTKGLARAYFARLAGEPLAAVIIFAWKGGAAYNSGASIEKAQEVEANSLLLWHSICEAAAAGCSHFDVGEAAPLSTTGKAKQLSDFKRAFGAELYPLWRGQRLGPGRLLPKLARLREAVAS